MSWILFSFHPLANRYPLRNFSMACWSRNAASSTSRSLNRFPTRSRSLAAMRNQSSGYEESPGAIHRLSVGDNLLEELVAARQAPAQLLGRHDNRIEGMPGEHGLDETPHLKQPAVKRFRRLLNNQEIEIAVPRRP